MIIDHSCDLHERVDDSRPDATEASSHHVLANDLCFRRLYGYLTSITESISYRLVINETPNVVTEGTKLLLNLQIR